MRYSHSGNARTAKLAAGITSGSMTIPTDGLDGWPDGTEGPFWATLRRGTMTQEKVLCSGFAGNTLQVWTDGISTGRGRDDTAAQDHPIDSVIEHVWTAAEAEDASRHVNEGEGAHGYPPIADLVTVSGAQTVDGKTFTDASLDAPVIDNPDIEGGSMVEATVMSLDPVVDQADSGRLRNIIFGSGAPSNTAGTPTGDAGDGTIYIDKG